MKQVGLIMSYDNYQEYREHKEELFKLRYMCMDWIPENSSKSSLQFIRYMILDDNKKD